MANEIAKLDEAIQTRGHIAGPFATRSGLPRPKRVTGADLMDVVSDKLQEVVEFNGTRYSRMELCVEALLHKAEEGDMRALTLIFEHIKGKPTQTLDINKQEIVTMLVLNGPSMDDL